MDGLQWAAISATSVMLQNINGNKSNKCLKVIGCNKITTVLTCLGGLKLGFTSFKLLFKKKIAAW